MGGSGGGPGGALVVPSGFFITGGGTGGFFPIGGVGFGFGGVRSAFTSGDESGLAGAAGLKSFFRAATWPGTGGAGVPGNRGGPADGSGGALGGGRGAPFA